jgi:chromosome segregation ATPase
LILINKQLLEDQQQAISESENRYKSLKATTDYEVHMKEIQSEDKLKKVQVDFEGKIKREQERYEELVKLKQSSEIRYQETITELEKDHHKTMEELEVAYEKKIKEMNANYEEMKNAKDDFIFKFEEKARVVELAHAEEVIKIKKDYEAKLREEHLKFMKLQKEIAYLQAEQEEILEQQEEEFEFELISAAEKSNTTIQVERDMTMSLKVDTGMLKKSVAKFQADYLDLQSVLSEKDKDIARLKVKIQDLEENILSLKKELEERNFTIGQKESRILEVKQKNQELEKYRYVLDYKISELSNDLNPKEKMMSEMGSQIKKMDEELQRSMRRSEKLDLEVTEKNTRIESLTKELKVARGLMTDKEKTSKQLIEDIIDVYCETDPAELRNRIKHLYNTYVNKDQKKGTTQEDKERMQELARQRQYMEHSLGILKQKNFRSEERLKKDVQKKVGENSDLINELNNLRKENWELKTKLFAAEVNRVIDD